MTDSEYPICFDCAGAPLVGIVHPGTGPAGDIGVVIVVGGPQYRIGSHRQFVLLARDLAIAGIPVFRFDMRGMGDSGGDFQGFETVDDDIDAAIDALLAAETTVRRVVLWGLCDGASAIMFYAQRDPRVAGIVVVNPEVRTEEGHSQTQLRYYYLERFLRGDFWRRLVTGRIDVFDALGSFITTLGKAAASIVTKLSSRAGTDSATTESTLPLPDRMASGFDAFRGAALLIISGNDLTAREFVNVSTKSSRWQRLLARRSVTRYDLVDADHTMSHRGWADDVARQTILWLNEVGRKPMSDDTADVE